MAGGQSALHTKRFAYYVGRRCRATTIREPGRGVVAARLRIRSRSWTNSTCKGSSGVSASRAPKAAIGIDEISVGRGHEYRIVVGDLIRGRPIWSGGEDRSEKSLDAFFCLVWLRQIAGKSASPSWTCGRLSATPPSKRGTAGLASLYDKFRCGASHLSTAMDEIRRNRIRAWRGKERRFIKGQRFNLLDERWENLELKGRQALKVCLFLRQQTAQRRVPSERFVRAVVELRNRGLGTTILRSLVRLLEVVSRLKPFEKFAAMIDTHVRDGIASYCHVENKSQLGLRRRLQQQNPGKIQGRAYGYRDEEYFRLKILTCMLDKL